jgi:1,4-alpha-glucan branching enzyme
MWGHPGKKLLFMGCEFGQEREWNHDTSLDWHLLQDPFHKGVQLLIRDLNHAYAGITALHQCDTEPGGFQWLVADDRDNSVIAWARHAKDGGTAVVVSNFTPVPRPGYRIGVPKPGFYREAINTDSAVYGGSNIGNMGGVQAQECEAHGQPYCITLTVPPSQPSSSSGRGEAHSGAGGRVWRLRLTSTRPPTTSSTASPKPSVMGSPRTTAAAATPNSGAMEVPAWSGLAG